MEITYRSDSFRVLILVLLLLATGGLLSPFDAAGSIVEKPKDSAGDFNAISYKIHVVTKGETLESIAARKDMYGDPIKWCLIYMLNLEELSMLYTNPEIFSVTKLPEGLTLMILLPEESRKRAAELYKPDDELWVLNIRSVQAVENLRDPAARLIDEGYLTYITKIELKGETWYRLRVGFFRSELQARQRAQVLSILLSLPDIWVQKAKGPEILNYIGYAPEPDPSD